MSVEMPKRGKRVIDIFMPISPAPPHSSAQTDHRVAAVTPSDTSVSMVEDPYRAARAAARWKGQAPQVTTGRENAVISHCQPGNCSGGIIDKTSTGAVRIAEMIKRLRSPSVASPSGCEVSCSVAVE